MNLSPRLQLIYSQLLPNIDVWDICCDHGLIGGSAYKSQNFNNIYFVDQVESIIENIKNKFGQHVYKSTNTSNASFIALAGQSINTPVTGNLCITGVGAITIYEILTGLVKNNNLKALRLILGPHKDEEKLLNLIQNDFAFINYSLTMKHEINEKHRCRVIYVFDVNSISK